MGKQDKQILVGLLAAALILIAVFFVMRQLSGPEAWALISIDGEAVQEINLNTAPDQQINLSEYGVNVVLEIQDHRIHFLSSDCPGPPLHWIWLAGQRTAERRLHAQPGGSHHQHPVHNRLSLDPIHGGMMPHPRLSLDPIHVSV